MKFNIRYIDTSDWLYGEIQDFWIPSIQLDKTQYLLKNNKINEIYSVVDSGSVIEATSILNKNIYLTLRRFTESNLGNIGYDVSSKENYALDISQKIKYNIVNRIWTNYEVVPKEINLIIVRRVFSESVIWLNNAFYLGSDPEADSIIDL